MADDQVRVKYDIDGLLKRIPPYQAEFFTGFVPTAEHLQGWRRTVREREPETNDRAQLRTVWDDPRDPASRILIDIIACASAADAVEMLATMLENNQLERVLDGPGGLGLVSFMHPPYAPPAVYFVYGNLSVLLASFGSKPADVVPVARQLSARMEERPAVREPTLSLSTPENIVAAGRELALDYKATYPGGEDAYWKFVVTNGTVVRREGGLRLKPFASGEVRVESYLIEPGRPPQFGQLSLRVGDSVRP
ncbi:MAG: hypothetical protein E6G97_09730 [Alphaproteobacteria bacterium]|nr:MAG: hypothetical protein E6G97_09730 [Alphaproteobacteria bacterium]